MTADATRKVIAHLIAPRAAGDPACFACATLIEHAPPWAQHVVIGALRADDVPRIEAAGLQVDHRIPPRVAAALGLRAQLARVWRSIGSMPACLVIWPGAQRPLDAPGHWTLSASELGAGPWPIDAPRIQACDRIEVRRAWGVPDDARVILFVGEPAHACDAWTAAYLGGVLSLAKPPTWVVVPAGAHQIDRGLRFVERHKHAWGMIVDDAPLARQLAGADAAVHALAPPSRHAHTGARADGLAWATATGLPVIAQASPAIDPNAPHMKRARIAPPDDRRALAHAVSQLLNEDNSAQRTTRRTEVLGACNPRAFAESVHDKLLKALGRGSP